MHDFRQMLRIQQQKPVIFFAERTTSWEISNPHLYRVIGAIEYFCTKPYAFICLFIAPYLTILKYVKETCLIRRFSTVDQEMWSDCDDRKISIHNLLVWNRYFILVTLISKKKYFCNVDIYRTKFYGDIFEKNWQIFYLNETNIMKRLKW